MKWRLIGDRVKDDRGATLMMVAGMMTALLAVSAFAVDLGWLYLNASRLQKAADAAALAGVVNLPAEVAQADIDAQMASSANKFPIGTPITNTFASQVLPDNKFKVTLGTQVESFFLKVVGFDNFDISRTSTAQYVLPVPLGSPANCFGIGQAPQVLDPNKFPGGGPMAAINLCDSYVQNFWGAVNGRYTAREHGDPYLPACFQAPAGSCVGGTNGEFEPNDHYFYGIDVGGGQTYLDVWLFDAGFYDRGSFNTQTGDSFGLSYTTPGGADTTFTLKSPDGTPYDPTDNAVYCTLTISAESNPSTFKNLWEKLCGRISDPAEGAWVLKVDTSGSFGGSNQYSILVDTSGLSSTSIPRVYGINDMSIFTNDTDGDATVWLAEILPVHAGKQLRLRFYDPGETDGDGTVTLLYPWGTQATNCSWTADNGASGSTCSFVSAVGGNSLFNGSWITMLVDIPDTYNCDPTAGGYSGCYWKMNLQLNVAHDRTTWEAQVIGNPVRLVPNA